MRPLWFLAGAGAGVYVMVRARRAVEAFTPEGFGDRMAGLKLGWELFGDEVREGMAERETELRERLLVAPHGDHAELPELDEPKEWNRWTPTRSDDAS